MTDRILITGSGVVSAIGIGKAETLKSLLEQRSGVAPVSYLPTEHRDFLVGEVKLSNDELTSMVGVPADDGKPQSRNALIARLALREALADAGLISSNESIDPEILSTMPLISGTTVAGMDRAESSFDNPDPDVMKAQMLASCSACGTNTEDIARGFGRFAFLDTISTACSSAANAIMFGANLIKCGMYDRVAVGGSESLSKLHFNGFNTLMILDKEPCRPFDESRAGLNLGEGAAYLILERESVALKRGVTSSLVLSAYGNACDAFHQTASSAEGEGAYLAMSKALSMGGFAPEDIDYINSHGTGTPNNDPSELQAMSRLFGCHIPHYSSTKGFTGHTTSASGSIEAVFCILALKHQFLPVSLNCSTSIEGYPSPVKNGDLPHRPICNVLCNAFGFGGNDSSFIISKIADDRGKVEIIDEPKPIYVLAHEVLGDDPDFKQYMSPGDARRLGKMLKRTLALSLDVLHKADVSLPDAIITGTEWGSIESSELFLRDVINFGEQMLKPTHFMQSTHNTLASLVAIQTKNHGYNCTHSQNADSLRMALLDAVLQMQLGMIDTALVGLHDALPAMHNEVYLLSTKPSDQCTESFHWQ